MTDIGEAVLQRLREQRRHNQMEGVNPHLYMTADDADRLIDYVAELEAQVAEARTRIAYAAESSTVTTSDNPGCFWCDHEEHTEKCWVPGWLARTAPKEAT